MSIFLVKNMNQHFVSRLQENVADLEQEVTNYTPNDDLTLDFQKGFFQSYLFLWVQKNVIQVWRGMLCNHMCSHPHIYGLNWDVL